MDKNQLKVQALLERISEITTTYENRVADLRVDLTTVSQEKDAALAEVERLNRELVEKQKEADFSDGSVVTD